MSEEEKKAIDILKQIDYYSGLCINCPVEDGGCDYCREEAEKTILKLIEKQQKEIEELRNDYNNLSDSLVVKEHCIKNSIPVEAIKDKIEETANMIKYLKQFGHTSRLHELRVKKRVLQELLEERK